MILRERRLIEYDQVYAPPKRYTTTGADDINFIQRSFSIYRSATTGTSAVVNCPTAVKKVKNEYTEGLLLEYDNLLFFFGSR